MSTAPRILVRLVLLAVVVFGVGLWLIRGPRPMDFAGGSTVALADYHEANPTGAPASLAKAGIVERGAYLAKAADCMVCHKIGRAHV